MKSITLIKKVDCLTSKHLKNSNNRQNVYSILTNIVGIGPVWNDQLKIMIHKTDHIMVCRGMNFKNGQIKVL